MQGWKDEFQAMPDQVAMQIRDSNNTNGAPQPIAGNCKGKAMPDQMAIQIRDSNNTNGAPQPIAGNCKGKGKGKSKSKAMLMPQMTGKARPEGYGPNRRALHTGRRGRFHLHMQRVGGTKQICEMILYTGRWSITALQLLMENSEPQPSDRLHERVDNNKLKSNAYFAKFNLRFAKSRASGHHKHQALVKLYKNGTLQAQANRHIRNYGHDTLRNHHTGQTLAIGGSTGGHTRRAQDGWRSPTQEAMDQYFQ